MISHHVFILCTACKKTHKYIINLTKTVIGILSTPNTMTQFFLKHTKQLQIVHAIFSVFSFLKKKGYEITVQSVFLRFNF